MWCIQTIEICTTVKTFAERLNVLIGDGYLPLWLREKKPKNGKEGA